MNTRLRRMVGFTALLSVISCPIAKADIWGADVAVLLKILFEDFRRFEQLRQMIDNGRNAQEFMRILNSGIDNSMGLLRVLPVKDENLLAQLRTFEQTYGAITELYGGAPVSREQAFQRLNDQTVAESIRMANSFKEYSEQQEENSTRIAMQSRDASPKGAARMQAETSAQILGSLAQLIRLNTQMLKLQSEQLALNNKTGKDEVNRFQKIDRDLTDGFQNFKLDTKLARF